MKVGFAGLGVMGGPMARHLVQAGHEVAGFNRSARAKASCRHEARSRHHRISGGLSETEVKELTVMPNGPSSVWAVTTQTPVAKPPRARRKAVTSKSGLDGSLTSED